MRAEGPWRADVTGVEETGQTETPGDASKTIFPVRILHTRLQILHPPLRSEAPVSATGRCEPEAKEISPRSRRMALRVHRHHAATGSGPQSSDSQSDPERKRS
jgi:hypothetical protein